MKRSTLHNLTLSLAAVACLSFAGTALARGPVEGYGPGYGPGPRHMQAMPGLSAEQQEKARKMYQEHEAATRGLRQEVRAKRAELDAQMLAVTPDAARIEALSRELGALQGKLRVQKAAFNASLEKEGLGMAGRHGGYGGHRGRDNGGDRGYGPCWR